MKLILSGTLESIKTRNDGTLTFTVGTQEMEASQAGNLFQLRNKYIKVLLSDTNVSELEIGLVDAEHISDNKKVKSHSQRLRAVLFKVHEAKRIPQDFDAWYKTEIERMIDGYKEVLNQE